MPYNNKKIQKARDTKNDEFFTRYEDIENEIKHYKDFLKGKKVLCNCNDYKSNFKEYFVNNFDELELEKLIVTEYNQNQNHYKNYVKTKNTFEFNINPNECGNFDCKTNIDYLKECDIVITNPPFSKLVDFIELLFKYEKKFIIIGSLNAVNYKELFPYFKNNKMWMGVTMFDCGAAHFIADKDNYEPEKTSKNHQGYEKGGIFYWRVNGVRWFTNIEHSKRRNFIPLSYKYNESYYPKYDNLDAIECGKVSEIPIDYEGTIGVPVSFIDKYCPEQFEILGQMVSKKVEGLNYGYPMINGVRKFTRLLIKHKN